MATPDLTEFERISRIEKAVRERLMGIPGVHGIAVGYKYRNGQRTDELAILVSLFKKRPLQELQESEIIPAEIEGVKTDVREAELPQYSDDQARYRPLRGGSRLRYTQRTVEHPAPGTTVTQEHFFDGTLGFMAKAKKTGKFVVVTCAHVVAGCDPPATAINRRVGQPDDDTDCSCCSKCWATVVGTVIAAKNQPLNPEVDVALIQLDKCVDPSPQVEGLGPIHGSLTTAQLDSLGLTQGTVSVRGFRTGAVRNGVVREANYSGGITCNPPDNGPGVPHNFVNVMRLENPPGSTDLFGKKGDSGSVVLDGAGKVVGLLFGIGPVSGVPSYFVCRIDNILSVFAADYDLEIVTNPEYGHEEPPAPAAPFSFNPAPDGSVETFEPSPEDLHLLELARDEVLALPLGQHLMQLVSRHVPEIRNLVRTKERVSAVWRRVAAPDLLRAAVEAVRSPETRVSQFVQGTPLIDRMAPLVGVLTRYGSEELVADLNRLLPLANRFNDASYVELRAWLKTTPIEEI